MNKAIFAAAAAILAMGCDGKVGDTGDSGTEESGDPSAFAVSWGSDSVTLSMTGGDSTYYWGMAETTASTDAWTGEDCIYGYTTADDTTYAWCHPATADGDTTLDYGADPTDLDEGSETVFDDAFGSDVTHYVEDAVTLSCWIGGHDEGYYAGLGCSTADF